MSKRMSLCGLIVGALCFAVSAARSAPIPVVSAVKDAGGVTLRMQPGLMRLQICAPRVIRVNYSPVNALPKTKSLSVIDVFPPVPWRLKTTAQTVTVDTGQLQAQVNRATGAVRFLNAKGMPLLSEAPGGGKTLTPAMLAGPTPEAAYQSQQRFLLPADEAIYGLGQHQDGYMDYRGSVVTLEQKNREVAVPFLVSSRGYGLLWDNPAFTKVSVGATDFDPIPASHLLTPDGKPGGLTGEYFQGQALGGPAVATRTDPQVDFNWTGPPVPGLGQENFSVRWTGSVQANQAGDYVFLTTNDDGVHLWIDDKPVIDDWNIHSATTDTATVYFAANSRHTVRMEYFQGTRDAVARLGWRPPNTVANSIVSWDSESAEAIDYYFFYGPSLDQVIAEYREATGQAPLPGKWALGYWQSKERYATQQEWLDIAEGYRSRQEPIDNIVQDWFYWDPFPWGSHKFDPKRYPDPAAGIAELHDKYHLHLMISVWGKFDPGSPNNPDANFDVMNARGHLYPAMGEAARYYDPFDTDARALYWSLMRDQIYGKGVDAWWLDASEPEVNMQAYRHVPTAAGLGYRVLNAFPLMHTTAVYQGQRAANPNKRVFILTRSAYAGQQRNGAATWSGDITATWDVFAHQIPAGLNFCLSGIPYWTTDIGAFFENYPGGSSNPEYRELFTRWFQYGAFCPIFRVHGTNTSKELWRFGPDTEKTLVKYDTLRYRLMPYLYSQAWQVTHSGGTLMRALVMDFPGDKPARELSNEFLLGPAFLVCPVTHPGAVTRPVYLPAGTRWTDFWTGQSVKGGQTVTAPAPIDTMPLYVRAGSVVPLGPFVQYATEKPVDPLELRVYPGANGSFTLYEDENDTYHYEKGVYATIPIRWDEARQTLTVGPRVGAFPGMLKQRTLHVVWVRPGHGQGVPLTENPDAVIRFDGKAVAIKRTP